MISSLHEHKNYENKKTDIIKKNYLILSYPNAMLCATSRACQCSSGLKYVCTSKEFAIRKAKQNIKVFVDDEKRS